MSSRSVEKACETVVQTRKMVKLASDNGWNFKAKKALTITNNFFNLVNVNRNSDEEYDSIEEDFRRQEMQAKEKRRHEFEEKRRNDYEEKRRNNYEGKRRD